MDEDVDSMSVKELKALITSAGLSFAGCSEKAELRECARNAQKRLAAAAAAKKTASATSGPASRTTVDIGGWETTYEYCNGGSEGDVDIAIVLMHGIGASPLDLVPLARELSPSLVGKKCLFAFPGAPGSSWWPLDPAQWMMQAMGGQEALAKMIRQEFPGLADCRKVGADLVKDLRRRSGPRAKIVLGGFSQGAMTSTDIALSLDPENSVDAIVHLSGAPIVVDTWAKALKTRKPRIYISHGRSDFVLPFAVSGWTKSLFESAQVPVTYAPHDGAHTVGPLGPLVSFLAATLSSS